MTRSQWILPVVTTGAVACAAQLPVPTSADVEVARERWSAITLAELGEGRAAYVANCAGCHQLYSPSEKAPAEWLDAVDEMRREENVEVSEADAIKIKQYLYASSGSRRQPGGIGLRGGRTAMMSRGAAKSSGEVVVPSPHVYFARRSDSDSAPSAPARRGSEVQTLGLASTVSVQCSPLPTMLPR